MIENVVETARLVIVSRDSAVLRPLWSLGELNCWQIEIAASPWEAMDKVQSGIAPDLLLLDLSREDTDGAHILRWLRRLRPALPIVMIGHPGDNGRVQECMRMGVRDYLMKPLDDHLLEKSIQRNLATESENIGTDIVGEDVEKVGLDTYFVGLSPVMRKIRAQAALLADCNVPVLILGEAGSGRETIARLIHTLSSRSGYEFAKINCASMTKELLERELFGYVRVAPNSHPKTEHGKLECCAKGTILLDEITEMPLDLQARLLQALQDKRFVRPATSEVIEVDVRILATTPRNMERAISENRFREDLHRHLSAYTIYAPPLRERKSELPFLSNHLMYRLARQYGLTPRDFSPSTFEAWQAYNWPGNFRELESLVKRYLFVGDEHLTFEQPAFKPQGTAGNTGIAKSRGDNQALAPVQVHAVGAGSKSLRTLLQSVKSEAERSAIVAALQKTGWNRKAAARLLKVSYRTVLYKIGEYRIVAPDTLPSPSINGYSRVESEVHDHKTA